MIDEIKEKLIIGKNKVSSDKISVEVTDNSNLLLQDIKY